MLYKLSIAGILLLAGVVYASRFPVSMNTLVANQGLSFSLTALAEDDEGDDEEDEEDDGDDRAPASSSTKKSSSTKTIMQTVTKQVVTYETKLMNDPEFLTDTDGDLLVDAIDPEPNRDQREYFTDTDGDGVPNAFDQHHDEDDFAYYDDTDENKNGILDSYE